MGHLHLPRRRAAPHARREQLALEPAQGHHVLLGLPCSSTQRCVTWAEVAERRSQQNELGAFTGTKHALPGTSSDASQVNSPQVEATRPSSSATTLPSAGSAKLASAKRIDLISPSLGKTYCS